MTHVSSRQIHRCRRRRFPVRSMLIKLTSIFIFLFLFSFYSSSICRSQNKLHNKFSVFEHVLNCRKFKHCIAAILTYIRVQVFQRALCYYVLGMVRASLSNAVYYYVETVTVYVGQSVLHTNGSWWINLYLFRYGKTITCAQMEHIRNIPSNTQKKGWAKIVCSRFIYATCRCKSIFNVSEMNALNWMVSIS